MNPRSIPRFTVLSFRISAAAEPCNSNVLRDKPAGLCDVGESAFSLKRRSSRGENGREFVGQTGAALIGRRATRHVLRDKASGREGGDCRGKGRMTA
jgi:hypothetical protein